MVSHHSFIVSHKFVGHRHCGNGDTMLLVVKGQDSTGSCFSLPLLLISKGHGLKARGKQLCDNWNPAFCFAFYLNGVHFRGEFQHVGYVSEQKIKC